MREYVADQLIASAKERGRIPDSAFSADALLQIANEEMETYLAPLIVRAQEDYYETDAYFSMLNGIAQGGALLDLVLDAPLFEEVPFTGTQMVFRVPSRAAGGALRNISFLDSSANTIDVPRISVDDLEQATWGFVLQGQGVTYVNRIARAGPVALKFTFSLTPSMLCRAASAAVITDITGSVLTLASITAPASPLTAPVSPFPAAFAAVTAFDLIKSTPGFEIAGMDRTGIWDAGASTLTLDTDPPGSLEVGDYVAPAHYTPVPQCPTALWALLAQSVAAECLNRLGDARADAQLAKRDLMEKKVMPLIQNRVKGQPQSVMRRHGILNAARRW